ncbi:MULTISPECIES: hypothetical protein [unclassified Flavobacterium]|uniref:hypothetical protein n=1 Tax=unclassified Flavobacterium TaxID=196869 RepID=UPI00105CDDB2|nr:MULTISPECIES: hypothetical protein [unclassified Flavobacterium]
MKANARESIAFLHLKYISDGADENAAEIGWFNHKKQLPLLSYFNLNKARAVRKICCSSLASPMSIIWLNFINQYKKIS